MSRPRHIGPPIFHPESLRPAEMPLVGVVPDHPEFAGYTFSASNSGPTAPEAATIHTDVQLRTAVALLRKLEWTDDRCPVPECSQFKPDGHMWNCELALFLENQP